MGLNMNFMDEILKMLDVWVQRNINTEQVKAALNAQQEQQIDKVIAFYLDCRSLYIHTVYLVSVDVN